jgi:hypothetical protein
LPCRRSRVRVPSSASKSPVNRGFTLLAGLVTRASSPHVQPLLLSRKLRLAPWRPPKGLTALGGSTRQRLDGLVTRESGDHHRAPRAPKRTISRSSRSTRTKDSPSRWRFRPLSPLTVRFRVEPSGARFYSEASLEGLPKLVSDSDVDRCGSFDMLSCRESSPAQQPVPQPVPQPARCLRSRG